MNRQYQYTEEKLQLVPVTEITEGHDIRINRLFPDSYMQHFDPFILMEEFFIEPPAAFPSQVHKGFESIIYMLDGGIFHSDSLGNYEKIFEADVQRVTAGRGIEHMERSSEDNVNHGIRLWVNLPSDKKNIEASYQRLRSKDLPLRDDEDVFERSVVGNNSPLWVNNDIEFVDILLYDNKTINLKPPTAYNGFIYVLSGVNGKLVTENQDIRPGEALFFENLSELTVKSKEDDCRFVMISGLPHKEPISYREGVAE